MLDESRSNIYDYLYGLLYDVVTRNVYCIEPPQDLTESDTNDGFVVIKVGDIMDESEFKCEAYAWVRCYIRAFIPPMSRGRYRRDEFESFERAINAIIDSAMLHPTSKYNIRQGSVLSHDGTAATNGNNFYHTYDKSFIIEISE